MTWEIPPEYTAYLLQVKEYDEKKVQYEEALLKAKELAMSKPKQEDIKEEPVEADSVVGPAVKEEEPESVVPPVVEEDEERSPSPPPTVEYAPVEGPSLPVQLLVQGQQVMIIIIITIIITLILVVDNFFNQKTTETLAYGYLSESTRQSYLMNTNMIGLTMIFKNFCALVLRAKVSSAVEGIMIIIFI